MNNKIEKLLKLYLLLNDHTEGRMHYWLFINVFINKEKIYERTINECYFISNGTRWKSSIKKLINYFEQDYENIYEMIIDILMS